MKKIYLLLFGLICFFTSGSVSANTIESINMEIYVDENGTANITETWNVKGTDGTEWYKGMSNLENSELSDFKVMMDGKDLKYKTWNVDESLEQKKGYYGINYTSSGEELCFGKYDFKWHKFTLNYTLSNYVVNTEDSQVLYWRLIDRLSNVDFKNFSVELSSYYAFPDDLDVWGYGYKGYAYVKDGKIYMSNEATMNDNYVVTLVKFPLGTFKTDNTKNGWSTFDDVLTMAEAGSFDYDYDDNDNESSGGTLIIFLFIIIGVSVLCGILNGLHDKYGYINNKKIDKKNINMFRDIPCNKDIYYAHALLQLNDYNYKSTNILGAIILKWVKEKKVYFINEKKGVFNKYTSKIDLTLNPTFDNDAEMKLFDIMYESSKDGYLEAKELERWARRHYDRFLNLFNEISDNKIQQLKNEGHIYKRKYKDECKYKNVMDDMIYDDSVKLYGLKKFLDEFSTMNEKSVIEVQLWDEYLMFAYLFGIADKVAKQFKNLYPEVIAQMEQNNFDYSTFVFLNTISTGSVSAATSARSAASSYSGGGGGFSSGGGGGGSFGGGGGGSR